MNKLEEALRLFKNHQETGDYVSLHKALKLVIEANKKEPENVSPLMRSLSFTILEPLYLQIEKHLQDIHPEAPKSKNDGEVIFVDFAKRKRAA